jgi:Fungal rhodopsin domain
LIYNILICYLVDNVDASIWSNIEVYTGIICASLPAIKPVIGKFFPKVLLSNRNGLKTTTLGNGFGTNNTGRPIRLHDVDNGSKTATRVEVGEKSTSTSRGSNSSGDLGKDIFVTISVKQDIEGYFESTSQYRSEEGFDFQFR